MNGTPQLAALLAMVKEMPSSDLPRLLGDIEEIRMTAQMRLSVPAVTPLQPDSLLNVAEAAKRLGVSEQYLYRHSDQFAFTRREGRKLLFSNNGIDTYIRQRR